jgi:hypothetical protein
LKTSFNFHDRGDREIFPADEHFLPGRCMEKFSRKNLNRQKTHKNGCFFEIFRNQAEILTMARPLLRGH